ATYLRGIDFIQVPTTLLAMVDSSVGGKTGINNRHGKNLIGAFWQPRLVLADTDTLTTLPEGERISALAEIIKYGVIYDGEFFAWIEKNINALRNLETDALIHAIQRSCEIKADVVVKDERESGLRQILNFGHTIGHAIENSTGYGVMRHGEAISIGMVVESALGVDQTPGWTETEHLRLGSLLKAAGLPTRLPKSLTVSLDDLFKAAATDKKNVDGEIRYMLPRRFGLVEAVSLANKDVAPHLVAAGARR
ncbi:MAG: 3-dehydroquinate synthase, partial [Candidatus Sumerlaeia bacterium]|nr:3-dehydroquinate synthase [Candidatus Sumerlaeia bacterium]